MPRYIICLCFHALKLHKHLIFLTSCTPSVGLLWPSPWLCHSCQHFICASLLPWLYWMCVWACVGLMMDRSCMALLCFVWTVLGCVSAGGVVGPASNSGFPLQLMRQILERELFLCLCPVCLQMLLYLQMTLKSCIKMINLIWAAGVKMTDFPVCVCVGGAGTGCQ